MGLGYSITLAGLFVLLCVISAVSDWRAWKIKNLPGRTDRGRAGGGIRKPR